MRERSKVQILLICLAGSKVGLPVLGETDRVSSDLSGLQHSISSVRIYYGIQSDIRVKSYCRLNLLRASVLHFERLDILRDSIRHLSKKVIFVWICSQLQHSISSVRIYYGTQSDIRVKTCCRLNVLRASTFNFERSDILRDSIRHPNKKLLSFEFAKSFCIKFRVSRYITGLNQTSE